MQIATLIVLLQMIAGLLNIVQSRADLPPALRANAIALSATALQVAQRVISENAPQAAEAAPVSLQPQAAEAAPVSLQPQAAEAAPVSSPASTTPIVLPDLRRTLTLALSPRIYEKAQSGLRIMMFEEKITDSWGQIASFEIPAMKIEADVFPLPPAGVHPYDVRINGIRMFSSGDGKYSFADVWPIIRGNIIFEIAPNRHRIATTSVNIRITDAFLTCPREFDGGCSFPAFPVSATAILVPDPLAQ